MSSVHSRASRFSNVYNRSLRHYHSTGSCRANLYRWGVVPHVPKHAKPGFLRGTSSVHYLYLDHEQSRLPLSAHRCYSIQNRVDRVDSIQDVEKILQEAEAASSETIRFADGAKQDTSKIMLDMAKEVHRVYEALLEMTNDIVKQAGLASPSRGPKSGELVRGLKDKMERSVDSSDRAIRIISELQERSTDILSGLNRAERGLQVASGFIADEISTQNTVIEDEGRRFQEKYRRWGGIMAAKNDLANQLLALEDERRRLPFINFMERMHIDQKIASIKGRLEVLQREWVEHNRTLGKMFIIVKELQDRRDSLKQFAQEISKGTERLHQSQTWCSQANDTAIQTKDRLREVFGRHLVRIEAVGRTGFGQSEIAAYALAILRIVLLAPRIRDGSPPRKLASLLHEICAQVESLPSGILDKKDDDDYDDVKPVIEVLREARQFAEEFASE